MPPKSQRRLRPSELRDHAQRITFAALFDNGDEYAGFLADLIEKCYDEHTFRN